MKYLILIAALLFSSNAFAYKGQNKSMMQKKEMMNNMGVKEKKKFMKQIKNEHKHQYKQKEGEKKENIQDYFSNMMDGVQSRF